MAEIIKSKPFLLGLIIVVQLFLYIPYFFQVPQVVKDIESSMLTIGVVIATFAMLVGIYTITRRELVKTSKRAKGWPYSVWLLFVTWSMIVVGVVLGQTHPLYNFYQNGIVLPGDATIYAILVFYMISAGARAFRMRDTQATLLIVVTVLVLLQQAPIATAYWSGFDTIGSWINNNLGMAITRVFAVITALGGIVLAVRLITGREMGIIGMLRSKKKGEGE